MAHARCMLGKRGYTRARPWTRSRVEAPNHTRAHEPTLSRTRKRDMYNKFYYLMLFHGNSGFANAPRCHVICVGTLPVLLL
jgi:hypothetical protein